MNLNQFNDAQNEAVTAPLGPVRVLAGAGSGKTKVLVSRIAWLIETEQAHISNILAVTFTNKAAFEMRERLGTELKRPIHELWLGTFHSLCNKFLRLHFREANLQSNFQVIDSNDQLRLCKRILKDQGIDEKFLSSKALQNFINQHKEEGRRPNNIDDSFDYTTKQLVHFYGIYQSLCNASNLIDFSEILLRTLETLRSHPLLLEHYQERFKFVLVDEFQDTNSIQYAWLKLLTHKHRALFVVGDDDQSIYGWRGAKVENILNFDRDFPDCTTIRLEQNYRSTSTILDAANHVIAKNTTRLAKTLWTDNPDTSAITVYHAMDGYDEGRFVVNAIKNNIMEGVERKKQAILYRSNAQSRIFEELLLEQNIPYQIYGGLRFFDRLEIKDFLAYLRLCINLNDDVSLDRTLTTPPKGIGPATIDKIRQIASEFDLSLWDAINVIIKDQLIATRSLNALINLQSQFSNFSQSINNYSLKQFFEYILEQSNLVPHYAKEALGKGEDRIDNINELISAAETFLASYHELNEPLETTTEYLNEFINRVTLEQTSSEQDFNDDKIQLMTLHSSKGLEFEYVFLVGLDDGLFPSESSIIDPQKTEEERRLMYVGITRARKSLCITTAQQRMIHGKTTYLKASRFLKDIPKTLIHEQGLDIMISRPLTSHKNSINSNASILKNELFDGLKLGDFVTHPSFGDGTITNFEGSGAHARVTVKFAKSGTKTLVLSYAKLSKLS